MMNFTTLHFDSIGSTNDEALRQARLGADEGLCIIADEQTKGRGRHGRTWVSEKGTGLYFSLVLKPRIEMRYLPMITLMAGVAVHDTLENLYGFDADIKWANDILVSDKKISGILSETCEAPDGMRVVVGIGINLLPAAFPAELTATATSIQTEYGARPDRDELVASLCRFIEYGYGQLSGADGALKTRRDWTERSSYAHGKEVSVTVDGTSFSAVSRGLERDGALRVELANGEYRIIHAGDVERLRATPK